MFLFLLDGRSCALRSVEPKSSKSVHGWCFCKNYEGMFGYCATNHHQPLKNASQPFAININRITQKSWREQQNDYIGPIMGLPGYATERFLKPTNVIEQIVGDQHFANNALCRKRKGSVRDDLPYELWFAGQWKFWSLLKHDQPVFTCTIASVWSKLPYSSILAITKRFKETCSPLIMTQMFLQLPFANSNQVFPTINYKKQQQFPTINCN